MKVSIFTPCHKTKWLIDAYESIKEQNFYEWVILYNNGAQPVEFNDQRVKTFIEPDSPEGIGLLKAKCCELATGDILLELDHDDLLTPNAVEEVKLAFADSEVGFAYSNTIHCTEDFKPVKRFNEIFGWRYRSYLFRGETLDEHVAFPPEPCSLGRMWYTPNHLRAFRKSVYEQVGGYNKEMRIFDDLDLMCRLYAVTKFAWIDKGLYLYREHGTNTYIRYNAEIQNNVYLIHDRYIESLAEKWTADHNLKKLELGGAMTAKIGYTTVALHDADVIADLNETWPFNDSSVGVIRAMDVLEHLHDSIHTMRELYRILAPGGYAFIRVPSTDGRGAFQDPTHKTFWNENSFCYYTNHRWNLYIDCPVRFQSLRCYTTAINDTGVCWTVAHLMKLGAGRVPGIVAI